MENTNWRNQRRDPGTGRWTEASLGDVGNPEIPTRGPVQLVRTNAVPDQASKLRKEVDLPKYDVQAGGESVGQVYAALSKPTQGGGQTKVWYSRKPGARTDFAAPSKEAAKLNLLRDIDHEVANAATTSKQEKLAKRQALMNRVIAETNLITTDNSLSAGGSGGYAPNGAIEMGPVAEKEYQSLLAQHKRETGMSKPGAQTNALKIRAINNTNPHLNERQRMILGDNLPTSKIGKKIIARDVAERPKNEAAAREAARAGYDPVPAQGYSELGPGPGPGESMAESIEDPLDRAVRLADMLRASILKQGGDQALADAAARELNRKLVAESTPGVVEELATDRNSNYRAQVASTFQRMGDQALDFQDSVVVGGIDREELDKEITNRRFGYAGLTPEELAAKYIEQDINPTLSATEQNSILSQLDRITGGRGQSYIDVARNGSGAGQELDPYNPAVQEIMSFNTSASAFSDLGSAIQGQLEDYLENPEREDLNPNAVRMIEDFLEEHSTDGLNNLLQASFDLESWKEYDDMGSSVQEQMESILNGEPFEEQNPNALEMISGFLRSGMGFEGNEVANQINDYLSSIRKKSIDLQFYKASLDELELQLQYAGMNTRSSRDETLRSLTKAMDEVKKIPDRGELQDSEFALPDERSYPIPDEAHGRLAIGRCKGKPEESKVRAAVIKKFPGLKDYAKRVLG